MPHALRQRQPERAFGLTTPVKLRNALPLAAIALCAGFYWAWWDSFHELTRFYHLINNTPQISFLFGGTRGLHCVGKPLGIIVGCCLFIVVLRNSRARNGRSLGKTALLVLGAQTLLLAPFAYILQHFGPLAAQGIYFVASAAMVVPVVAITCALKPLSTRQCALVIIGALCCYACLNNLLFPLLLQGLSRYLVAGFYTVLLAIAWLLARKPLNTLPVPDERLERKAFPPWQLVLHLTVYGFVFGMMHIMESRPGREGPYSINLGGFLGCIVAACLFGLLFLRQNASTEIWSKMRSTVFPLAIVGFTLIPLTGSDTFAATFPEAAGMLYLCFLFYASVSLMRRTALDMRLIPGLALLLYSTGEITGVVCAGFTPQGAMPDYLVLISFIVLLLTAATFWVGTDEQIRKIWGLRRNLAPKRYNDQLTKVRIAAMERRFNLTSREAQALLLIAQGKRAPEIQSVMGVSMSTVRSHIKHLYTKIDAHSYAEAVAILESIPVDEGELHAAEQSAC